MDIPVAADSPDMRLNRVLPAVAATVGCLRAEAAELAAAAGAGRDDVDRVRLAVSEAVTNVVEHAYATGGHGRVQLVASVEAGELLVLVSDDGQGLDSYRASHGLGLGLALMSDACDGMTVSARSEGGVEVQMRFVLSPERASAERPASGSFGRDQERGSSRSATRAAVPTFSTTM